MTGILGIYTSLLYKPQSAFQAALSRKVWTLFFPLIMAILITAAINICYYNIVDMPWLLKQMVANVPRDQKSVLLESLTKTRLVSISLVGVFLLTVSINLFRAFVYWFVLKIDGSAVRFTRLFAIVMWATAPLLIILPASILNIYMNANGMLPNDVNPVSFNQLFFKFPGDSSWGQLLSTSSMINVWELFLIVIGLRIAATKTNGQTIAIAMLPEIIVYGLWSAALLLR